MLSYPIPEAISLLQAKLDTAQSSLEACEEDLDFLREQITVRTRLRPQLHVKCADYVIKTMEVATARVYNWDVVQRRKDRAEEGSSIDPKKSSSPNG
jgi:hypothetical protein